MTHLHLFTSVLLKALCLRWSEDVVCSNSWVLRPNELKAFLWNEEAEEGPTEEDPANLCGMEFMQGLSCKEIGNAPYNSEPTSLLQRSKEGGGGRKRGNEDSWFSRISAKTLVVGGQGGGGGHGGNIDPEIWKHLFGRYGGGGGGGMPNLAKGTSAKTVVVGGEGGGRGGGGS